MGLLLEQQTIHRFSQSRRRPLLGLYPGRKPSIDFTFKTLLRQYAEKVLVFMKLGHQHRDHKQGTSALRLNVRALEGSFNQEKALVGTFRETSNFAKVRFQLFCGASHRDKAENIYTAGPPTNIINIVLCAAQCN